jgi:hypothetical protein
VAGRAEDAVVSTADLRQVAETLQRFTGADLTGVLARIEGSVRGVAAADCASFLLDAGAGRQVLSAAAALKQLAAQIHVAIHALGILLCLPHILQEGEKVEYVSLGAGNTGRDFDLETNIRVAEFKFIHWRGGPESSRQNALLKDFFLLAESDSPKRKYLYVLGTAHPLKFFNGRRALASVLSRNESFRAQFRERHGELYRTVRDYFEPHRNKVTLQDVSAWVPELVSGAADAAPEPTGL